MILNLPITINDTRKVITMMLMIVDDVLSFDAGFKMIYYGFNGYLMEDKIYDGFDRLYIEGVKRYNYHLV